MNATRQQKLLMGFVVLFLVMLACGPTPTSTPKQPTNTPEAAVVPTQSSQSSDSATLSQAQKSQLAHATVRIWGVQASGSQVTPIYHGSGTIISSTGLILTNCHVADPIAMGLPADLKPDALVIDLISTEDKPPVSTYLAKVVTEDPTLDLATIQIVANLDGSKVNKASLKLPSVTVGNSDQVKFGDRLFVFGYPGIGGDTITYVTGDVSGFDSEDPIGDRAWIKTEATIAGGDSGGLATNALGQIIGVPSQVTTGTASEATDCRRIQDTNGDGKIDQNDACVPTGGFINGIRPINWARPLIKAAQSGKAYTSPYPNPVANNNPPSNPTPNPNPNPNPSPSAGQFTLVGWSEKTDNNGCPVTPVSDFPTGTMSIAAIFSYSNMNNGDQIEWHWLLDGKDVSSKPVTWKGGSQGDCFDFSLANGSDPLPDGNYVLQLLGGPNSDKIAEAQTSIGSAAPVNSSGVTLTGQVVDADTGHGIAGIYVAVLKPGNDPDAWVNNPVNDQVLSFTQTDQQGNYQMPEPLPRGQKYGLIVGNKNIGYPSTTGTITIKSDAPDTIDLSLKISK
jgi:S1-C subfamily serine protease